MTNALLGEMEITLKELKEVLSSFRDEQLNVVPFEGSWTAAQVMEHLLKSYGVVETVNGEVKETERPPDENIEDIKATFLNFDVKFDAPEFILPSGRSFKKEELLSALENSTAELCEVIKTLDLSKTCLDFSIPQAGEYTRLEWLHLALYHTQRHIRQLKNIHEKLN